MELIRFGELTDRELTAALEVLQPHGTAVVPELAMWRSLGGARTWPPGPAVLQSLPF